LNNESFQRSFRNPSVWDKPIIQASQEMKVRALKPTARFKSEYTGMKSKDKLVPVPV
jgi:hypothetical protein